MPEQVFVSYASKNGDQAKRVCRALQNQGISYWFAPESMRGGQDFTDEIKAAIRQSRVFLLLWSRDAAGSDYVLRELAYASSAKPKPFVLPVSLDDSELEDFYTKRLHWLWLRDRYPPGLAQYIQEYLRVREAPYPLGGLYQELEQGKLDFVRHLRAIRLLVRFVALLHIAAYVHLRHWSDDLNRQIDNFLSLDSLFADYDLAQAVMRWLDEKDAPLHPGFREFFKIPDERPPGASAFEESDDAADEFDRKHLHLLCNVRDDFRDGSSASSAQAEENLCYGVREFMRRALTQDWSTACSFLVSLDADGTGVRAAQKPLELSDSEAAAAALRLKLPGSTLHLDPFFTLVRGREGAAWEIGLLRKQNGAAQFTPLTTQDFAAAEYPAIVLPWGRIEITRALPKVVYAGETHTVTLLLSNHAAGSVRISNIEEHLPDNLMSLDAGSVVPVAVDLELAAGEARPFDYQVRGRNAGGAIRSFAPAKISYSFQNNVSTAIIEGDREVLVQTIPQPKLIVTRGLSSAQGAPLGASVALDSEVTVAVEVRPEGPRLNSVHLEDQIEGAVLISGTSLLYSGAVERSDRQPLIHASYQLRVTGGALVIRTHAISDDAVILDSPDTRLEVIELPPPRLDLRWHRVERQDGNVLHAYLQISNSGGTGAYAIDIQVAPPGGVTVSVEQSPAFARLPAGSSQVALARIACPAVPFGVVRFMLSYHSVSGAAFKEEIAVDLNRVVETNLALLPVVGRVKTREAIRRALAEPDCVIFNLHGEAGAGKRRLLLAEIDHLRQVEGRKIIFYEFDCGTADSFAEAIALLLQRMVDADTPEDDRGSVQALMQFLRQAGMGDQYEGYIERIRGLVDRLANPGPAEWRAVTMLLTKLAKSRQANPLVILLRGISRFSKAELDVLREFKQYLQPPINIRIVLTSYDLLNLDAVDREIRMEPLSDRDCEELIGRTFIMPKASLTLRQALIEKSERLPDNLISLLRTLVQKSGDLLEFGAPAGVSIRDPGLFDDLPTTLVESERKAARSSGIPYPILAMLAAFREPVTIERLVEVLEDLGEDTSEKQLRTSLEQCQQHHWLVISAQKYDVPSATIRTALAEAAPADLLERTHQAIFTIYERERRSPDECFVHFVEAPAGFIAKHGVQLVAGLRTLVLNGRFTQVHAILARLDAAGLKLDTAGQLELEEIEQELEWEETGDLDGAKVEALQEQVKSLPDRFARDTLRTRLCLLASRWYSIRRGDHAKAASVAESAEQHWPRRLPVKDARLEFDFYLNLWAIYYRLLNEDKFAWADQWIWKRLATQHDEKYDSYAIAQFLGLFLKFQQDFESPAARKQHFPVVWVKSMHESVPLRENKIEALTRTEHIKTSFLDEFLNSPDRLNQSNSLILGRLYSHLGVALWAEGETRRRLSGQSTPPGTATDDNAQSYLEKAERLFAKSGFILDLASTRAHLGAAYEDRLKLAEKSGHRQEAAELCATAAQWLKQSATGFEAVDASQRACAVWETYANVVHHWAALQPVQIGDAIQIYRKLIDLPPIRANRPKLTAYLFVLVKLYEEAGMLDEATRLLDEMEVQTAEVGQLRAMIHADALAFAGVQVTTGNAAELARDIETLRSGPPVLRVGLAAGRLRLSNSVEAIGVIAWRLANFHAAQQRGVPALETLRAYRNEIAATPVLENTLRDTLPVLLPSLWEMEGSTSDRMTQDFTSFLLPLMTPAVRPAIEDMLDRVWTWESARTGGPYLAAADMSLILIEWSIGHGRDAADERDLAQHIFDRLRTYDVSEAKTVARMLARSLAVLLRAGAAARNEGPIRNELAALLTELQNHKRHRAALWIVLHLAEQLLDLHRATQNAWYFTLIAKLADKLGPLQEQSPNDFEDAAHLISVYLQLPNRIADAVDLMEKQCEHLLAERDYELLPQYLSFLSDLLGDAVGQDYFLAQLLRASSDGADLPASDTNSLVEFKRTTVIRKKAIEFCGRIIAEIRRGHVDRRAERSVLYDAAKLLRGEETADLQAAIYAKLYDLSDEVDGSCVWAVYNAWEKRDSGAAALSAEDGIALTTFSNSKDEAADGQFRGNPRNYLITARKRNMMVRDLSQENPDNADIFVAFAELEIQRLAFLDKMIEGMPRFLEGKDEFEEMQWVTFFYSYLLPASENAPSWQKKQRIDNYRANVQQEISMLQDELRRRAGLLINTQRDMHALSYRVQQYLVDYRRRGREIMGQLAERIRPFELPDILGEVQRQIEGQERFDFGAVLGLWTTPQNEPSAAPPAPDDISAFLNRDPRLLIKPLLSNGMRLLNQGEPALAERLYRFALGLCGANSPDQAPELPAVLHGLAESLSNQERYEEARDMAMREVETLEAKASPELAASLMHLANILEHNGQGDEALACWRRHLDLAREQYGTEQPAFASSLKYFAQFLSRSGNLLEAEAAARQALAIDEKDGSAGSETMAEQIFDLVLLLVLRGNAAEAQTYAGRAWTLLAPHHNIYSLQLLFVRIVIALLEKLPAQFYIGQMKTFLRTVDASFREDAESNLKPLISYLGGRLAPEASAFLEALADAIDDPAALPALDGFAEWPAQPAIALDEPWPVATAASLPS